MARACASAVALPPACTLATEAATAWLIAVAAVEKACALAFEMDVTLPAGGPAD